MLKEAFSILLVMPLKAKHKSYSISICIGLTVPTFLLCHCKKFFKLKKNNVTALQFYLNFSSEKSKLLTKEHEIIFNNA